MNRAERRRAARAGSVSADVAPASRVELDDVLAAMTGGEVSRCDGCGAQLSIIGGGWYVNGFLGAGRRVLDVLCDGCLDKLAVE